MQFVLKSTKPTEAPVKTPTPPIVRTPREVKATPKPAEVKFRTLTQAEIKDNAAQLSDKIVDFVLGELKRRFGGANPPIHAADAMQVGMTAMAVAEGLLTCEAMRTGASITKLRAIHDTLVLESMQRGHA
jgi:hypothetical protein